MFGLSISQIAQICNGTAYNSFDSFLEPKRIVIDSRKIQPGDLFAAFKGEQADGHDYISVAFEKGAICCLAERYDASFNGPVIVTESVQLAVERIAAAFRNQLIMPIVGITGSVGKTTAKEMISAVLSTRFSVLKTDKNLNNQLGVPITVSNIMPEHNAAVIEMGVSKIGDMALLGDIVHPHIAVFTNIGHAHLEFLKNLEGVFQEKTSMLHYMEPEDYAIINGDDPYLAKLKCKQKVISYGLSDDCDIRAKNIRYSENGSSTEFTLLYQHHEIHLEVPAYGKHIVYAAMMGAAAGFVLGLTDDEIITGIQAYETVGRRANVLKTGFVTLIDDCYNANPDSVNNAIDSMSSLDGRKICILGDMLELGEDREQMHKDIGLYAVKHGIDKVITSGPLSRFTAEAAGDFGIYFKDKNELKKALPDLLQKNDNILVKASLGSRFDEISEFIKQL